MMYCPKCSQAQASDEMRFCSRCGFPLSTVALLLDNDGTIPTPYKSTRTQPSWRSRMATESVFLTVLSWAVALAATFWFDRGGPLEIVAKLAAVIFFTVGLIGLLRFLYAFIFVKDNDAISDPAQRAELLAGDKVRPGLPTPQPNPINEWSRPNTREMVSQLSVTENTTQLLDNEDV